MKYLSELPSFEHLIAGPSVLVFGHQKWSSKLLQINILTNGSTDQCYWGCNQWKTQVSSIERTTEVTGWLQQARQELSESWTAAEKLGFAEKYQVTQRHKFHAIECFSPPFSAVRVVHLLLRCSSTSPTPSLSKAGRWRPSSLQSSVAPSWAGSRALWGRRASVWRVRWGIHKPDAVVTFKCQKYLFYFKQRKQKQTKKQTAMVLTFEKGVGRSADFSSPTPWLKYIHRFKARLNIWYQKKK